MQKAARFSSSRDGRCAIDRDAVRNLRAEVVVLDLDRLRRYLRHAGHPIDAAVLSADTRGANAYPIAEFLAARAIHYPLQWL